MPGSRSNRPPPGQPPVQRRWWHRADHDARETTPADEAYESSAAGEQERLITEALADLRDMDVREVMTPRADVAALTIPVTADDVAQAVRESGHSCFPVVNDDLDDLVGILFVNDLFRSRSRRSAGAPASVGDGDSDDASAEPSGQPSPLEISRRLRQPYVDPRVPSHPRSARRDATAAARLRGRRRRVRRRRRRPHRQGPTGTDRRRSARRVRPGRRRASGRPRRQRPLAGRRASERRRRPRAARYRDPRRRLRDARRLRPRLPRPHPRGRGVVRVDGWDLRIQEMDKRRIVKVVIRRPVEAGETPSTNGTAAAGGIGGGGDRAADGPGEAADAPSGGPRRRG